MKRLVVMVSVLLLTACGGGGGSSTSANNAVPNVTTGATTAASAFSAISGRFALTSGTTYTANTYFNIPSRGAFYISLGEPSTTATLSYSITSSIPASLPTFDTTKTIVGVAQVTTDVAEQLTGQIVFSFDESVNYNLSSYQVAYYNSGAANWTYGLGTPTTSGKVEPVAITLNSPLSISPNTTTYLVLYGS